MRVLTLKTGIFVGGGDGADDAERCGAVRDGDFLCLLIEDWGVVVEIEDGQRHCGGASVTCHILHLKHDQGSTGDKFLFFPLFLFA